MWKNIDGDGYYRLDWIRMGSIGSIFWLLCIITAHTVVADELKSDAEYSVNSAQESKVTTFGQRNLELQALRGSDPTNYIHSDFDLQEINMRRFLQKDGDLHEKWNG